MGAKGMSVKQITWRVLSALIASGILSMTIGAGIGGWGASQKYEGVAGARLDALEHFRDKHETAHLEIHAQLDTLLNRQQRHQVGDYQLMNYKVDLLLQERGIPVPVLAPRDSF